MKKFRVALREAVSTLGHVNQTRNANLIWKRMLEGNARFVDKSITKYITHYTKNTSHSLRKCFVEEQKPFAIVVCCSDSRISPELVFNEGIGFLFVVRLSAGVVDKDALGSIEFIVKINFKFFFLLFYLLNYI